MSSTHYRCHVLMKLEFSRHVFRKYSKIYFHEHRSSGSELLHAGRWTDRRTAMTKLIVAFRNFLTRLKMRKLLNRTADLELHCIISTSLILPETRWKQTMHNILYIALHIFFVNRSCIDIHL